MKKSKANKINIIFSSFLVIGYIVCAYFFSSLASQVSGATGMLIQVLMLAVFGLLLFYATRVGEGKQVRRFSLAVLLLIDLPSLYIILAGMISAFPLHDAIAPRDMAALFGGVSTPSIIMTLACVALGYGIPYTFFSGYEIKEEIEEVEVEEEAVLEGGLAEELADTEAEEAVIEETAKEAIEAETPAEEAAETEAESADEKEEIEEKEAE